MFFFNHELNQLQKKRLDICKWFHQLKQEKKSSSKRWLRAGTGLSHAIGRTFPYEGGGQMGSVRCQMLRCYGVGGLSPNRLAWFFWGSFLLFFQTKYLQAQSAKNISRIIYRVCFFNCSFKDELWIWDGMWFHWSLFFSSNQWGNWNVEEPTYEWQGTERLPRWYFPSTLQPKDARFNRGISKG